MSDDQGILGNLPRSRPGRRSDRRAGARPGAPQKPGSRRTEGRSGASATRAARSGSAASGAATSKSRGEAARAGAGRTARTRQPRAAGDTPPAPPPGDGLVTGAARAVLATGEAGLRLASRLAGEAVRRLPRP